MQSVFPHGLDGPWETQVNNQMIASMLIIGTGVWGHEGFEIFKPIRPLIGLGLAPTSS